MNKLSVLDILEETTRKHSHRIAVIDDDVNYTYNMILKRAKIIGFALSRIIQDSPQKPIMLFMEKSCKYIVSMFGILYSRNIYVPLDIKNPKQRINEIINNLESEYILSSSSEKRMLEKIRYTGKILIYEELLENQC